jgi:hypothetical protein
MKKVKQITILFIGLLIIMYFLGCKQKNDSFQDLNGNAVITDETNAISNEIGTINEIAQQYPTESIENISTPTPDLRTLPTKWMEYPIVPQLTNNAISIYKTGITKGVNPKTFSKIGDCQNIKEAFLGIYDTNRYYLIGEDLILQETIDNFKGFFNRDGESIEQGLNVAASLSPLQANPDVCGASESPLDCELRIVNPIFAFVSFERWWPNETPIEVYKKYLRLVIEKTIERGTIPILVTKADNIEGKHQINQIIANLAFEYDIPIYNWWKAAQLLPHRGMDPERNDGFHISTDAWDSRSYYGLKTLNSLLKGLENIK